MKLLKLSREQLADFRAALSAVGNAATALADAGLEPEISLSDTGTILRAGSIVAEYAEAPEVRIEVSSFMDAGRQVNHPTECADTGLQSDDAQGPMAPLVEALRSFREAQACAESAVVTRADDKHQTPAPEVAEGAPPAEPPPIAALPEARLHDDGLVRGPWKPEEEQHLIDLHATGSSWREIAAELNRPLPAVEFRGRKVLKLRKQLAAPTPAAPAPKKPAGRIAAKTPNGNIGPAGAAPSDAAGSAVAGGPVAAPPPAPTGEAITGAQVAASGKATPGDLAGEARRLFVYLSDLPAARGWDPELDLDVCEMLASGVGAQQAALDLGIDMKALRERYSTLSATIRNDRGHIRIDGQAALLTALRRRAMLSRSGTGVAAK